MILETMNTKSKGVPGADSRWAFLDMDMQLLMERCQSEYAEMRGTV